MGYLLDSNNKVQSLADRHPELVKEWNYEKNFLLKPEDVSYGSGQLVWWKCDKGHEWQATIHHRHRRKNNCPTCISEDKYKKSIVFTNPECLKDWDYNKNKISPYEISAGSEQKVWWKCNICEHSWKDLVCNYIKNVNKCPKCRKEQEFTLFKDCPELLSMWDYTKNKIDPNNLSTSSSIKVWWKCENKHSWEALIINMVKKLKHKEHKEFCPTCNSLGYKRPELVKEIFYEKNNIDPFSISFGSDKKIWWKCDKGHIWKASISTRAGKQKHGCHECYLEKNRGIKNSLLLKEWDYSKNKKIDINSITEFSDIKVWWVCSRCKNSWKTSIGSRSLGHRCPKCSRVTKETSLKNKCPKLMKEYSSKNTLNPQYISFCSSQKILWECDKGHEWWASPSDRYRNKNNKNENKSKCPYCSGRIVCKDNSLFDNDKKLTKDWNYNKNGKLTPKNVTFFSCKNVWWLCSTCGHEWKATVNCRHRRGIGCPNCCKNVLLKDGTRCDSLLEAYFYLLFKKDKRKKFLYNKKYPGRSRHKYDFYFPEDKTFIEVTGYNERSQRFERYINNINEKKSYVENILGKKFIFIQKFLTKKEYKYVRNNIVKYNPKAGGFK